MRSDFDDFRAAFFDRDLGQKWGRVSIRWQSKMLRDKIPRRVHGPVTKTKRKHQIYSNIHTRGHRKAQLRPRSKGTQDKIRAFQGMI